MGTTYRNPVPTVDIIIEMDDANRGEQKNRAIVLISRRNPPLGWALPGGFVDYGESLEHAARREALEETSLEVELVRQFHSYSDPRRDPRQHTITTVFIASAKGVPQAADDAREARLFTLETLPENIAFDHKNIIMDYYSSRY